MLVVLMKKCKYNMVFRLMALFMVVTFSMSLIVPPSEVLAQSPLRPVAHAGLNLPPAGEMVHLSPAYVPPTLKGIIVHPENPFQFDFILDNGDAEMAEAETKSESEKLIKYFLTALTLPEDDLWVNLSPYEADRIIPDEFGRTEMGQVLLEQDYLLKQLTASLMNPEEELGEEFWGKVYEEAYAKYGVTDIPVNMFNKVWIVPSKALVYENVDRAFVVESHLRVMLEEDYFAMEHNAVGAGPRARPVKGQPQGAAPTYSNITTSIIREILIPAIEQEVNQGQHFAKLRQVYHSFILASWYKKNLKKSVLNKAYSDHKKIGGLETGTPNIKEDVYQRYLDAFKAGAYDLIKEEYDPVEQEMVARKYFSGGAQLININTDVDQHDFAMMQNSSGKLGLISTSLVAKNTDAIRAVNDEIETLHNTSKMIDLVFLFVDRLTDKYKTEDLESSLDVLGVFVEMGIFDNFLVEKTNILRILMDMLIHPDDEVQKKVEDVLIKFNEFGLLKISEEEKYKYTKKLIDIFNMTDSWDEGETVMEAIVFRKYLGLTGDKSGRYIADNVMKEFPKIILKSYDYIFSTSLEEATLESIENINPHDVIHQLKKGNDPKFILKSAQTLAQLKMSGIFNTMPFQDIYRYSETIKEGLKIEEGLLQDDDLNARLAVIFQMFSKVGGVIVSDEIAYIGQSIDAAKEKKSREIMLDVMSSFSLSGSRAAQDFLEEKFNKIMQKKPLNGNPYLTLTKKENEIIHVIIKNFPMGSILPVFANEQLPSKLRFQAMEQLMTREDYELYEEGQLFDEKKMKSVLASVPVFVAIFKNMASAQQNLLERIQFQDLDFLLQDPLMGLDRKDKDFILHSVIEPLLFSDPQDLSISIFNKMIHFFQDTDTFKYFLFYVLTHKNISLEVKKMSQKMLSEKKLFPLHKDVKNKLGAGKKEILIVQNLADGMGDELIRTHALIQSFLGFNPDLQVTLITNRGYLYDHPRVTIQSFNNALRDQSEQNIENKDFDVIVNYKDQYPITINNSFATYLQDLLKTKRDPFFYVQAGFDYDFHYNSIKMEDRELLQTLHLNEKREGSGYAPTLRLLAELGIPFRLGEKNKKVDFVVAGIPYPKAQDTWNKMMGILTKNKRKKKSVKREVVLLNLFGGGHKEKGYDGDVLNDVEKLKTGMRSLIANGFDIVLLPNDRAWGGQRQTQKFVKAMDINEQGHIVIAPEPQKDQRFFNYFVLYADHVITVEGGLMHLAYALGKSMGIIIKGSRIFKNEREKWIPFAMSKEQGIIDNIEQMASFISKNQKNETDESMISSVGDQSMGDASILEKGGIDFNRDYLNIESQGNTVDMSMFTDGMQNIHIENGLVPKINSITPVTNLQRLFGKSQESEGASPDLGFIDQYRNKYFLSRLR